MFSRKLSMQIIKQNGVIILLLFIGLMISGCHRDLSDPFVPKDKKFNTQFKFDKKRNRTVEKHVSFSKEKGKFKDSFAGSRGRGKRAGGSHDSYSSKSKKSFGGTRFSKSKGRVVEKGFLPSKRSNDSYSAKAGHKDKKHRSGGKDSYSSSMKKHESGNRFSKSKNRVVSFKNGSRGKRNGSESFGSKRKNKSGNFSFSTSKNRVVSNKGSRGGNRGGKDSYGSKGKRNSGNFGFNKSKKRVVSFKKGGRNRITGADSYGGKTNSKGSMFRFDKKSKRIVSKKKFLVFGSKRHSRDMGSYAGKKRNSGGMFSFNSKKHRVIRTKAVFNGFKRFRAGDSFGGKRKSKGGEFSFNVKKKRVGKRTLLFKPRDTDPGSFGSKGGKRNSLYKQNSFNKKKKRIHHRNGFFWDLFGGRNKVSRKKDELQLDLFDPKQKHRMHLAR